MKFKIVADSSANLYRLEGVDFTPVPLKILVGDREYVDDVRLNVPGMLRDLHEYKGKTSTSCPNIGDWLAAFGDADVVLGVALTSGISGGYHAACMAAKEYMANHPGRQVFILDSLTTGPELELLVEKYGELVRKETPFAEICRCMQAYLQRTHLMFSLASLENFARNGRVNPALAKIAGLLGIRIVGQASAGGELQPLHKCRGEKRAILQVWNCMREAGYAGGKVRIRHTENREGAEKLAELIRQTHPEGDVRIDANRGLCAYYAQEGGVLVGFESA